MAAWGQEAPSPGGAPPSRPPAVTESSEGQTAPPFAAPPSHYDPAMFLNAVPAPFAGLAQFDGVPGGELWRDKQFRKALKSIVPNCTFHYGRDMSMDDALEAVMASSRIPVRVRDARYLLVSGLGGQYLAGRGFVWVDLKTGIGLGGFYFQPTNGEPTPSFAVFSRQVKEDALSASELPPAFLEDTARWTETSSVPDLTTRYFITGENRRLLLEHDEDFCAPTDGTIAASACEQENADAADLDLNAAYYLQAVNYRTNATAWMISPEQTAWIGIRNRQCGGIADPLGCRIRLTRERIGAITRRPRIVK